MHQVPASVWNEIARTQELRNPSFRQLMAMPQDKMLKELGRQAEALTANKVPDSVINAYQAMAPLLAENEAISQHIEQTGNLSLRAALPEVLNAPEAVAIASKDRSLSRSEKKLLLTMLKRLEPSTSINV